jgi:hypothetical protein
MYLHLTDFKPDCYFGEGQLTAAQRCHFMELSDSAKENGEPNDALIARPADCGASVSARLPGGGQRTR